MIVERPTYEPLLRIPASLGAAAAAAGSPVRGPVCDRSRSVRAARDPADAAGDRHATSTTRPAPGSTRRPCRDGGDARAGRQRSCWSTRCIWNATFGVRPSVVGACGPERAGHQQPDESLRAGWVASGMDSRSAGDRRARRHGPRPDGEQRRGGGGVDDDGGVPASRADPAARAGDARCRTSDGARLSGAEPRLEALVPGGGNIVFPRVPRGWTAMRLRIGCWTTTRRSSCRAGSSSRRSTSGSASDAAGELGAGSGTSRAPSTICRRRTPTSTRCPRSAGTGTARSPAP